VKDQSCRQQDQHHLHVADQDVGDDLAEQHLQRPGRHGEQVFHGAPLPFAGNGQAGDHDHGHGQHHPHQAGDDVVLGDPFRIVAGVDAELQRIGAGSQVGERPLEIVLQRRDDEGTQGTDGVAGGRRIGGVRLHQHHGAVTPQQVAGELHRNGDEELHLPPRQQLPPFPLALHLANEIEIAARPDRLQEGAPLGTVVRQQHRRGQMLRVGVDGKTEQHQLDQGNPDHHAEGEPVAAHLDELLHHDCPEARRRKCPVTVHGR